jgi:hypothetical protein
LVGLIAAWGFNVEAREAGVKSAQAEVERWRAELRRRAPVTPAEQIDPTKIGVDAAAQDILSGGDVPTYVARDVDEDLRAALAAAFDGRGRWLVVVMGPSKVGKSRALFEAVTHCAEGRKLEFVAPADGDALRTIITAADDPAQSTLTVFGSMTSSRFSTTASRWRRCVNGTPALAAGSSPRLTAVRAASGSLVRPRAA